MAFTCILIMEQFTCQKHIRFRPLISKSNNEKKNKIDSRSYPFRCHKSLFPFRNAIESQNIYRAMPSIQFYIILYWNCFKWIGNYIQFICLTDIFFYTICHFPLNEKKNNKTFNKIRPDIPETIKMIISNLK